MAAKKKTSSEPSTFSSVEASDAHREASKAADALLAANRPSSSPSGQPATPRRSVKSLTAAVRAAEKAHKEWSKTDLSKLPSEDYVAQSIAHHKAISDAKSELSDYILEKNDKYRRLQGMAAVRMGLTSTPFKKEVPSGPTVLSLRTGARPTVIPKERIVDYRSRVERTLLPGSLVTNRATRRAYEKAVAAEERAKVEQPVKTAIARQASLLGEDLDIYSSVDPTTASESHVIAEAAATEKEERRKSAGYYRTADPAGGPRALIRQRKQGSTTTESTEQGDTAYVTPQPGVDKATKTITGEEAFTVGGKVNPLLMGPAFRRSQNSRRKSKVSKGNAPKGNAARGMTPEAAALTTSINAATDKFMTGLMEEHPFGGRGARETVRLRQPLDPRVEPGHFEDVGIVIGKDKEDNPIRSRKYSKNTRIVTAAIRKGTELRRYKEGDVADILFSGRTSALDQRISDENERLRQGYTGRMSKALAAEKDFAARQAVRLSPTRSAVIEELRARAKHRATSTERVSATQTIRNRQINEHETLVAKERAAAPERALTERATQQARSEFAEWAKSDPRGIKHFGGNAPVEDILSGKLDTHPFLAQHIRGKKYNLRTLPEEELTSMTEDYLKRNPLPSAPKLYEPPEMEQIPDSGSLQAILRLPFKETTKNEEPTVPIEPRVFSPVPKQTESATDVPPPPPMQRGPLARRLPSPPRIRTAAPSAAQPAASPSATPQRVISSGRPPEPSTGKRNASLQQGSQSGRT